MRVVGSAGGVVHTGSDHQPPHLGRGSPYTGGHGNVLCDARDNGRQFDADARRTRRRLRRGRYRAEAGRLLRTVRVPGAIRGEGTPPRLSRLDPDLRHRAAASGAAGCCRVAQTAVGRQLEQRELICAEDHVPTQIACNSTSLTRRSTSSRRHSSVPGMSNAADPAATPYRNAVSRLCPQARLQTMAAKKLSPAPTTLTNLIGSARARRTRSWVTNSAPWSPSVNATISTCPLSMRERQAVIRSAWLSSDSPIKILNSRRLGLTKYTPACRAAFNGGPEVSMTSFLPACFAV